MGTYCRTVAWRMAQYVHVIFIIRYNFDSLPVYMVMYQSLAVLRVTDALTSRSRSRSRSERRSWSCDRVSCRSESRPCKSEGDFSSVASTASFLSIPYHECGCSLDVFPLSEWVGWYRRDSEVPLSRWRIPWYCTSVRSTHRLRRRVGRYTLLRHATENRD